MSNKSSVGEGLVGCFLAAIAVIFLTFLGFLLISLTLELGGQPHYMLDHNLPKNPERYDIISAAPDEAQSGSFWFVVASPNGEKRGYILELDDSSVTVVFDASEDECFVQNYENHQIIHLTIDGC
jgi:hypothetical protein